MFDPVLAGSGTLVCLLAAYYGPHVLRPLQTRRLARRCATMGRLVLTYDDGPGATLTPCLLDLLLSHNAKATFFLLGARVAGNEQLIERMVGAGHEIGCHGHSHVHAWRVSPAIAVKDLRRGYAALERWVAPDGLYRPPCGKMVLPMWLILRRRRAHVAWWTVDSGDTHNQMPEPERVADEVSRARGGVVLMHDFERRIPERRDYVLRTTELLLRTARREGLVVCRYGDL